MDVIEYKAEHLLDLSLQESQLCLGPHINPGLAKSLEIDRWSWTGIEDGVVLGCAGVLPIWQGRGMAWAYISDGVSKNRFLKVHRAVSNFLDGCHLHRIEMTVDWGFDPAHRWARMLGFVMEAGCLRAYTPNGNDVSLYARIR